MAVEAAVFEPLKKLSVQQGLLLKGRPSALRSLRSCRAHCRSDAIPPASYPCQSAAKALGASAAACPLQRRARFSAGSKRGDNRWAHR
eukprot:350700-Chlamydomonas_euryale.AAC.4